MATLGIIVLVWLVAMLIRAPRFEPPQARQAPQA